MQSTRLEEMIEIPFTRLINYFFAAPEPEIIPEKQDVIESMMRSSTEEITSAVRGQLRYGRDHLIALQQALIQIPDTKENKAQCQQALQAVQKAINEADAIEILVEQNKQLLPALKIALQDSNITPENITRIMAKADLLLAAQRTIFYNPTEGAHARFQRQLEEFDNTVSRATILNHKGRLACLLFAGALLGALVLCFPPITLLIMYLWNVVAVTAGLLAMVGTIATGITISGITIYRSANHHQFFPTPEPVRQKFSRPLESKLHTWADTPARRVIFSK